jgi:hypothetical protein
VRQLVKKIPLMRYLAARVQNVPRRAVLKVMPRGSVCAEIGVDRGDFSHRILQTVQPHRLHLIDPWEYMVSDEYKESRYGGRFGGNQAQMDARYASVLRRFRSAIDAGQVVVHRAYSQDIAPDFDDDYFDWVYVDGNHLYEYVKQDLELFYPRLKPGGYIAGDDYISGGWWQGGVKQAVDEFVASGRVTVVLLKNGQFILQKTR